MSPRTPPLAPSAFGAILCGMTLNQPWISDRQAELLLWYDAHARDLPWRTRGGARADPYRVWLSEVMLQQTTVAVVKGYFDRFTRRWPTVAALAAAPDAEVMAEWAGLGYYARARNLLACARAVVARHAGRFPGDLAALRALPGIGPYTAGAIAAIAFDLPEVVVDGNVERVISRLFAVETPLPDAKPELIRLAALMTPQHRPGDHAQALMDLGATLCTPRSPACGICPWVHACAARAAGIAVNLPRKRKKPEKPVRQGQVWIARRSDGALLLETRAAKGLLGGMLAFPGTGWDGSSQPPPLPATWTPSGSFRHTFTHFHLDLAVLRADVAQDIRPMRGEFLGKNTFSPADLPGLMRKAHAMAFGADP
jgi:A/G-specific adenine glycosylase